MSVSIVNGGINLLGVAYKELLKISEIVIHASEETDTQCEANCTTESFCNHPPSCFDFRLNPCRMPIDATLVAPSKFIVARSTSSSGGYYWY